MRRTEKGLGRTCRKGQKRCSEGHFGKDGEGARKNRVSGKFLGSFKKENGGKETLEKVKRVLLKCI